MSTPNNLAAYTAEENLYSQALSADKGIEIDVGSEAAAKRLRQRLYNFRRLHRARSIDMYPEGHPDRGSSVYDEIEIVLSGQFLTLTSGDTRLAGYKVREIE